MSKSLPVQTVPNENKKNYLLSEMGLYRLLISFFILGVLFPALALCSKLAANNFSNFYYVVNQIPGMTSLLHHFPILDIGRNFPVLSEWSWHAQWNQRSFPQYILINGTFLGIVITKKREMLKYIQYFLAWLRDSTYQRPRRYIALISFVLVATFLLKINLGFWFPGIAGWTYADWKSRLHPMPPRGVEQSDKSHVEGRTFLHAAVLPHNARYLSQSGYVKGKAIFLHFQDGQILPGNFELLEMVYPEYVFGRSMNQDYLHGQFFRILQESLANRRAGKIFLLPISLSYPNHNTYMSLDYQLYPDPSQLQKISFWDLVIHISEDKNISIVSATQSLEIHGVKNF